MNGGSMVMIQKQRSSRPNGSCLVLQPEEGAVKAQQIHSKIETVLTVFLNWESVSIMSMPLQPKQIIKSTTSIFFISWETQYATAMGNWWLATSPWQASSCIMSYAEIFLWNVKSPKWLSPDLVPWNVWLFPKLKSPLKGKRFQTIDEIQENVTGQLMTIPTKDFAECFEQWEWCWENLWGPKVPTLKVTEVSLCCVQWFLYLLQ